MQKPHDESKACLTAFVQDSTLTAVIEMSLRSWLVGGMVPGINRGATAPLFDSTQNGPWRPCPSTCVTSRRNTGMMLVLVLRSTASI